MCAGEPEDDVWMQVADAIHATLIILGCISIGVVGGLITAMILNP